MHLGIITPYPPGRLFWGGAVPGTSCQATIAPSLRDIPQKALARVALCGWQAHERISALRAAASWLFFRVARSTVMIQIAALYRQSGSDRLEKQPTDLRRNPRDLGDGALRSPILPVHIL